MRQHGEKLLPLTIQRFSRCDITKRRNNTERLPIFVATKSRTNFHWDRTPISSYHLSLKQGGQLFSSNREADTFITQCHCGWSSNFTIVGTDEIVARPP